MGFTKSKSDPNLYFKVIEDEPIILLLYMDDLFLTRNENQITYCKKKLVEEFEMKILEVWKSLEGIFLNKGKYVVEILKNIWYVGL